MNKTQNECCKENRVIGLDILRVFSMIGITLIHYIGYSDILQQPDLLPLNYSVLILISTMCKSAVNVFILITGYFMIEKRFDIRRAEKLWVRVFYTSMLLLMIGLFVNTPAFCKTALIKSVFPVISFHYWFINTYIALLLLLPLLNRLIYQLSQKGHRCICIMGFIVICILLASNPFTNSQIYIGHSHGIVWIVYLYIVGAYFRRYDILKRNVSVVMFILAIVGIYIIQYSNIAVSENIELLENDSLLPFILSISIFCLFKNIKINSSLVCKLIYILSSCSFFVYLFQEHEMIRKWYWSIFHIKDYASTLNIFINMIVAVIIPWIISIVLKWFTDLAYKLHNLCCGRIHKYLLKMNDKILFTDEDELQ